MFELPVLKLVEHVPLVGDKLLSDVGPIVDKLGGGEEEFMSPDDILIREENGLLDGDTLV